MEQLFWRSTRIAQVAVLENVDVLGGRRIRSWPNYCVNYAAVAAPSGWEFAHVVRVDRTGIRDSSRGGSD
ncbi:hypothetical protein, partial [Mycobacterium tuberculosis]|uniref:hypothetical protein n=1 Tax=Mycobacterium tuberculosis TaxID=1773 RepID=UPI000A5ABC15